MDEGLRGSYLSQSTFIVNRTRDNLLFQVDKKAGGGSSATSSSFFCNSPCRVHLIAAGADRALVLEEAIAVGVDAGVVGRIQDCVERQEISRRHSIRPHLG